MISFRFHLVSITAVFLALAAGIAVGAAVVDRATVEFLEGQLAAVEVRREATNARNEELAAALGSWDAFAEQAGLQLVDGQLAGPEEPARVVVLATAGTDERAALQLRQAFVVAGASSGGTLWLTPSWALEDDASVAALAAALGEPATLPAATLRSRALQATAAALGGEAAPGTLEALVAAGFAVHEAGSPDLALEGLATPGTRVVVLSGDGAEVDDRVLAVPLVRALSGRSVPVAAVQPDLDGPPTDRGTTEPPEPGFVASLRADPALAAAISTVDTVTDWRGLVATVLAVDALADGRLGHYGLGPGAERIVPSPAP